MTGPRRQKQLCCILALLLSWSGVALTATAFAPPTVVNTALAPARFRSAAPDRTAAATIRRTAPRRTSSRLGATTTPAAVLAVDTDGAPNAVASDCGTVLTLTHPATGQTVTLIGTAHLSQKSNEQVTSIITTIRPDAVMIELDEARLERIGLTTSDFVLPYVTAEDIIPPPTEEDVAFDADRPWWNFAREALLDGVTQLGRSALTGMYDDLSAEMGDDVVGGGEFLAAIQAAEALDEEFEEGGASGGRSRTKIVLGDRDSLLTLRRVADLALRTGDPFGVLGRLSDANGEEMEVLEAEVKAGLGEADATKAEITAALIEAIKGDEGFRTRVFGRLEKEVPEFTRAFLTERDYIMAEAIYRESDARNIVAVLGLAHLPGVAENLKRYFRGGEAS